MPAEPRPLAIIGAGAVGQTLGRLLAAGRDLKPVALVNRSLESGRLAARFIGGEPEPLASLADLGRLAPLSAVMIATGDRFIGSIADGLAKDGLIDSESLVFHCSGALGSEVLSACARRGAAVASVHPLATFANRAALAERFMGTFCVTEGDPRALAILTPAFSALGARVVPVTQEAKVLYHAGAVFASNYLLAILEAALCAEHLAGIESATAREMLAPLIRMSVENGLALGASAALTGPLARGDDDIVRRQYGALADHDKALARCYADMTAWAAHALSRNNPLGDVR